MAAVQKAELTSAQHNAHRCEWHVGNATRRGHLLFKQTNRHVGYRWGGGGGCARNVPEKQSVNTDEMGVALIAYTNALHRLSSHQAVTEVLWCWSLLLLRCSLHKLRINRRTRPPIFISVTYMLLVPQHKQIRTSGFYSTTRWLWAGPWYSHVTKQKKKYRLWSVTKHCTTAVAL